MRGFVLVNYGDKFLGHLKQCIKCIRHFSDYPITVYTNKKIDCDAEVVFYGEKNHHDKKYKGIGNCTELRTKLLIDSPYDEACYIDADIYIIHRGFLQGFEILESYPILMPQNPRWFVTNFEERGDSDIGAYVNKKDRKRLKKMPKYLTAWNGGVQFVKRGERAKHFYRILKELQQRGSGRNQTKMAIASWKTGIHPYVLPPNWCVCQEHVDIEIPLALHCGHGPVMKLWKDKYENNY